MPLLLSEDVPRHHQPPQGSSSVSCLKGLDLSWALRLCRPPGKQACGALQSSVNVLAFRHHPTALIPPWSIPFSWEEARGLTQYTHCAEQPPTWAQPGTRFSKFQHYQPPHCQSQRTRKGMRPTLSLPLVPHALQPIPHQGS